MLILTFAFLIALTATSNENADSPEQPTWPPPPDVPDSLAKHDDFLTALICAPSSKPPSSRLLLVQELRKSTGQDLRQCKAVVNDYCDRRGVFPKPGRLRLWLTVMFQFGPLIAMIVSLEVHRREIVAAPTLAERHLLRLEGDQWQATFLALAILMSILTVLLGLQRRRRDAEKARATVSG